MSNKIETTDESVILAISNGKRVDSFYNPDGHGRSWGWSVHEHGGALWRIYWRNKRPDYSRDESGQQVYTAEKVRPVVVEKVEYHPAE